MRSVILSKWDTVAGNERSSWACLMLLDMYQDVAEVSAKKDLNKKTNKPKTTCMPQPLGIYMKTFCMLHVFVIVFVCVFGRPFELSLADGWTLSVWRTFFFSHCLFFWQEQTSQRFWLTWWVWTTRACLSHSSNPWHPLCLFLLTCCVALLLVILSPPALAHPLHHSLCWTNSCYL